MVYVVRKHDDPLSGVHGKWLVEDRYGRTVAGPYENQRYAEREADKLALAEAAPAMRAALQWLLEDMDCAGETHSATGEMFDSVEYAVVALIEARGSFDGYTVDDAIAYREREAAEAAAAY